MVFLFCQPGLNNKNTIDFLIKNLVIDSLNLKKNNTISLNSFKNNKKNQIKLKRFNLIFQKLSIIFNGIFFLFKLKETINNRKISHLVFDSYTFFDFFFFSFLGKNKMKIIIYLRIPYGEIFGLKILFNIAINRLKKFQKIVFITDTDKLKSYFNKKYKIKCCVIPIPSKIATNSKLKKINKKNLTFLFPGKSREEKGVELINQLFNDVETKSRLRLKFNSNKKIINALKSKKGLKLQILSKNLTYNNYIKSIKNSDIIILPYTHPTYKFRSSGVFVDTIKLNKIVMVAKNTWMSEICIRKNLKELSIANWKFKNLSNNIDKIMNNFKKFKVKYSIMRNEIIENNSDKKFDFMVKKLFI